MKTFYGIIYKYTNTINGKVYIGQTTDEAKRYRDHMLRNKKNDSPYFHKAIDKYGFDKFEYKVLYRVYCSNRQDLINTLNQKEIAAVKFFKSHNPEFGYNLTIGGAGGTGRPVVSIFNGGTAFPVLKIDPTTGDILGRYESILEATKENGGYYGAGSISAVLKGKNYLAHGYFWKLDDGSPITLPELPEDYEDRLIAPKAVYKISKDTGEIIEEFPSLSAAYKSLGLDGDECSSISNACNGKSKSAYGFIWAHKDEFDPDKFSLSNYRRWTDRMVKVAQYTFNGDFVKFFDCIEDAVKETGADWTRITDSCKDLTSHHQSAGFLWRYEKDFAEKIPPYEKILTKVTPVEQYSKDGEFIREFSSLTEAARALGRKDSCSSIIYRSCKNNKEALVSSSCGYMWKFKENDDK